MNVNREVDSLVACYGDGVDGNAPTQAQWRRVLERDPDQPFALINFFQFRKIADYQSAQSSAISGEDAFDKYAAVSIPSMKAAGGEFLLVAPFAGSFLGDEEDWNLVAIGKYPNLQAFLSLYQNEEYIRAFAHRTAAVAQQKVMVLAL